MDPVPKIETLFQHSGVVNMYLNQGSNEHELKCHHHHHEQQCNINEHQCNITMTGINVIIIITFPLVFLMDAIAELRTVKRVMHRIGCVHCTSNANHRHRFHY